ncbi:MAG: SseB family protein [Elusimicrobiota bacterium]
MKNSESLIPSEALEGLMKKAFIENAAPPGLFWDALIKAKLFVPIDSKEKIQHNDDLPDRLPMRLGLDSKGQYIAWAFTSPQAMVSYTESDMTFLGMPAQLLLKRLQFLEFDMVLIGPEGLTLGLDSKLVDNLIKGEVPEAPISEIRNIPQDAQMLVGAPTISTEMLEKKLLTLFLELKEVVAASFLQIQDDKGDRLLLGLTLSDESKDDLRRVASYVAGAAEGVLEKGNSIDITLINGSLKAAFEKYGKNFFKRD